MKYPKIKTVFKRDPDSDYKFLIEGEFATPEFRYLSHSSWLWTEKVDGTNIRVVFDKFGVRFFGRTDRAQIPTHLHDKLVDIFPVDKLASVFDVDDGRTVTLFGEGYGYKIQKRGGVYLSGGVVGFILFDVFIGMWLKRDMTEEIAERLETPIVPVIGSGSIHKAVEFTRKGFASRVSEKPLTAEGLVMKPTMDLLTRRRRRIIAKIKHSDFPR